MEDVKDRDGITEGEIPPDMMEAALSELAEHSWDNGEEANKEIIYSIRDILFPNSRG